MNSPSDVGQSRNANPEPVLVVMAPHRIVTVVTTRSAIASRNGPRRLEPGAVGAGVMAGTAQNAPRRCDFQQWPRSRAADQRVSFDVRVVLSPSNASHIGRSLSFSARASTVRSIAASGWLWAIASSSSTSMSVPRVRRAADSR